MRRKCVVCKKLTENWQRVCGGPWHCFDGCFSTTGRDNRTEDGKPKPKASYTFGVDYAEGKSKS